MAVRANGTRGARRWTALAFLGLGAVLAACGGGADRSAGAPTAGAGEGVICGDPRLVGREIGAVGADAPIPECGAPSAIRLSSAAGVRVEPAAVVNCATARSLATWLEEGVQPAAEASFGRRVAAVRNAASYACRRRNHQPGARLSEHSFANAIDISQFQLAERGFVPISGGWSDPRSSDFLRAAWRSACGPFKTVLGPEADRFHETHLHLDMANRRSTYCR